MSGDGKDSNWLQWIDPSRFKDVDDNCKPKVTDDPRLTVDDSPLTRLLASLPQRYAVAVNVLPEFPATVCIQAGLQHCGPSSWFLSDQRQYSRWLMKTSWSSGEENHSQSKRFYMTSVMADASENSSLGTSASQSYPTFATLWPGFTAGEFNSPFSYHYQAAPDGTFIIEFDALSEEDHIQ
ncbi:hypothetical protein D9758_007346 [Tetrapyrgos nigripes]|uniref:Uncharacterized protein n=1 Tax=Tetrapyrgos nigripes TaxID=182062 RepID=A0A8H5GB29_9AGAR|nr:hypothetical protein D9758_007346 [Tetrapyrgos nigripes]